VGKQERGRDRLQGIIV